MNYSVPDWNMDDDFNDLLSMEKQKKSTGADQGLKELMWRNGRLVLHNQTHRKSPPINPASKCGVTFTSPSNLIPEEETAPWFQCPLDYTIDKEFGSEFMCDTPVANGITTCELNKNTSEEGSNVLAESILKQPTLCQQDGAMPAPKSFLVSSENGSLINFSHFSRPMRADLGRQRGPPGKEGTEIGFQGEAVESSSMITIGSSVCESNQVHNRTNQSRTLSNGETGPFAKGSEVEIKNKHTDTYETTITSSSGGSDSSYGRTGLQRVSNTGHKRKECEYDSVGASREVQRSKTARRSRAAEVHNLSERRRRDRINEKMRALQELIPHCNKTDKASMLDEAIEYLKSLQLQVQLMWMGSGMTSMMFPGVQHYMSHMGIGLSHATIPSIHGHVPLPHSTPPPNLTTMCQSSTFTPLSFPIQMQNTPLPEHYARFISFNHMQPSPQAMSLYPYGSHVDMVQQNRTPIPSTSSSGLHIDGGGSSVHFHNGKPGST